jgi:hypothetical protein
MNEDHPDNWTPPEEYYVDGKLQYRDGKVVKVPLWEIAHYGTNYLHGFGVNAGAVKSGEPLAFKLVGFSHEGGSTLLHFLVKKADTIKKPFTKKAPPAQTWQNAPETPGV